MVVNMDFTKGCILDEDDGEDFSTSPLSPGDESPAAISSSPSVDTSFCCSYGKDDGNVLRPRKNSLGLSDYDLSRIRRWNSIAPPVVDRCVHSIFGEQARRRPDAPAVCAWDGDLTYRELDELSSRIAVHLIGIGVEPGALVALCFDKSMWAVVAMLSVLKAGAACVSLGPDHPLTRLESIIRISKAKFIISSRTRADLALRLVQSVVVMEHDFVKSLALARAVSGDLPSLSPHSVAYVLFTSGTTGEPKGIVIEHGSLSTSSEAHGSAWKIGFGTRVLQFAAYTFDVSVADVFTTLTRGACVCVPSERERFEDLAGAIRRMKANWAFLTPSVAHLLQPTSVPELKTLVLGGEAVTKRNLIDWADALNLIVCYGPAECTVYCMGTKPVGSKSDPANIGNPIGSRLWIVDPEDSGKLAPIGVIGELLIEGRIVARGYLGDEVKTAAQFLSEPAWLPQESLTGERRLYKSGDLVCYNYDGTMTFVGRKDLQVKIRGQRVELGEIEHNIIQNCETGSQVAVHAGSFPRDEQRQVLAAFLKCPAWDISGEKEQELVERISDSQIEQMRSLQALLATSLPSYMVPSLYVPVQSIPLTPSGKTDRRRLWQLLESFTEEELNRCSMVTELKQLPSTEKEIKMQALWSAVLGIRKSSIGANDNFLRLGGDSIKAMYLVTEAGRAGLNLAFTDILHHTRLSDMAEAATLALVEPEVVVKPFSMVKQLGSLRSVQQTIAELCNIHMESIEDVYPCTPLQEGLIALSQQNPGDYASQHVINLTGGVDVDKVMEAWNTVFQFYDILRTRIVWAESLKPMQVVVKEGITWNVATSLEECLSRSSQRPIENGGLLTQFTFIRSRGTATSSSLIWKIHHALYDGFSLPLILKSFKTAYDGGVVEPPTPFKDFIAHLDQKPEEISLNWWQAMLHEFSTLSWPSASKGDFQLSSVTHEFALPRHGLHCTSNHTIPTVLKASWAVLLAAYSNSEDVVFGFINSGRTAPVPGILKVAGPTLNTVPFRVAVDPDQTLEKLLGLIQSHTIQMYSHEYLGLQNIKRISSDAGRACSFGTLLVVQPSKEESTQEEDIPVIRSIAEMDVGTYPITLECKLGQNTVELVANYNRFILSPSQAERLLCQFEVLIQQMMISDASLLIKNLQLAPASEDEWLASQDSANMIASQDCIHSFIDRVSCAQPSAAAIHSWDGMFTYSELDELSSKVQARLQALGLKTGMLVPICAEKSAWVVVAMLGILKAGGAFVPLDSSSPLSRLRVIVEQTQANIMFVSPAIHESWAGDVENVLDVSDSIRQWQQGGPATSRSPNSRDLAYIIFTSGSTGLPKGVMVEHGNYLSGAVSRMVQICRNQDSRVIQFSSYSFDTSIEDILTTLLAGGCICVPSENDRKSNLACIMEDMKVNCADLTPSVAALLSPADVPSLRVLIVGGESMNTALVKKWAQHVKLINTYGPTECSIVSTIAGEAGLGFDPANIGSTTCGRAWVVSPWNRDRLTPLGAVGELLLEGPLLARGYLHDQAKTNNAFVTGLAWASADHRFYMTGDLVRMNESCSLTFVCRKDTQVKVRGQRVELEEVERHLLNASETLDVVVEVISSDESQQVLAAFLVMNPQSDLEELVLPMTNAIESIFQAIQRDLTGILPDYMIPSLYIPMNTLPSTISGKLDRKRLHSLVSHMSEQERLSYRLAATAQVKKPETRLQKMLQRLWSQLLKVPPASIGLDSNFFRVGGDSISAMQLAASTRREDIFLTVAEIFRHPKLQDMAGLLINTERSIQTSVDPSPFSLLRRPETVAQLLRKATMDVDESLVEDIYPCTPLQEGLMAISAQYPNAYIAQHIFKLPIDVDISRLQNSWDIIVERNAILRTRIVYVEGQGSLQVVLKGKGHWFIAPSLKNYLASCEELKMSLGDELSRLCLVEPEGELPSYLVWSAHHSVFDGQSVELLLQQVYEEYLQPGSTMPAPSFSRIVAYIEDVNPATCQAFWQSQLDGAPSTALLLDKPRKGDKRREEWITHTVPLSIGKRASAFNSTTTPAMMVRAAWGLTLAQYCASDDIVFGLTLTGRNVSVAGITEVAAPCMTTVPVRIVMNRKETINDYLYRLQAHAIDMIPFEHTGLQNIKRIYPGLTNFDNILIINTEQERPDYQNLMESIHKKEAESWLQKQSYYTDALVLECTITETGITLLASYDANLASRQHISRILCTFAHILEQLQTKDQNALLDDIEICSPQDWKEILGRNRVIPQSRRAQIHDLIARHALNQPNAPAIHTQEGIMKYHDLELCSRKLAVHLACLGLRPNSKAVVPLCFEKSVYTVICMLAVLKCGAAYVALDPSHPALRLQGMVSQIRANIILVSAEYAVSFKDMDVTTIVVDHNLLDELPQPTACTGPSDSSSPDDVALVVFTSGSTGKPKPISISHRAVCTCAAGFGPRMDFGSSSRVLQNAAYAFDIHACEIFFTLIYGGCLVVSNKERSSLAEVVRSFEVNWLFSTPSATRLLDGPHQIPSVKTLMMIGEAPTQDIIAKWVTGGLHLINAYGPAENTLFSTMADVDKPGNDCCNIGKGINTRTWIVDPWNHDRLSCIGSIGELILEGPQLADGYLYEPEKTAASFISPPKWVQLQEQDYPNIFYKTGDLVHYEADGSLRIVGRKDAQVKIRGQRLELGEVEFWLNNTLGGLTAAAGVIGFGDNRQVLTAFVEAGIENNLDTMNGIVESNDDLKMRFKKATTDMAKHIPTFMVPSLFVPLQVLPSTASGKLDRLKLHSLALTMSKAQQERCAFGNATKTPPKNDNQRALQKLWSLVLNLHLEDIGIEDSFFSLGGDSISAIRLSAAAAASSSVTSLTVADIMQHPVLSDMADCFEEARNLQDSKTTPYGLLHIQTSVSALLAKIEAEWGIPQHVVQDVYPCTALQESFMASSIRQKHAYTSQQVYRLPLNIDVDRFEVVWRSIIEETDILRTRIVQIDGGCSLQVVIRDSTFTDWHYADSLEDYLQADGDVPMTYGTPLTRFCIVKPTNRSSGPCLVLTWHHAIFDQWSISLLLRQVSDLYNGRVPVPTIPFRLFIEYLASHDDGNSDTFWRSQLEGSPTTQILQPTGRDRTTRDEQSLSREIPLGEGLTALSLPNLIQAAFGLLMFQYADSDDIVFGLVRNGRQSAQRVNGLELVAGPTITTVPYRAFHNREQSVRNYLEQVKCQITNIIPHQHTGLQRIKGLGTDAANACDFQCILDINFEEESTTGGKGLMTPEQMDNHVKDRTSYYTHAIIVDCTIHASRSVDINLNYDGSVMSLKQAQQLVSQISHLIQQLLTVNQDLPLIEVKLLNPEDENVIFRWNKSSPWNLGIERTIHELVELQARSQPEGLAIEAWDGSLTYAQLDQISGRLAAHLIHLGVGPEVMVPICFDKSLWTPVCMLACLKSGGGYVPLDPSHPAKRLQGMVEYVGTKLILVSNKYAHIFEATVEIVLVIDDAAIQDLPTRPDIPLSRVNPDNTALIVFTSGSTGMPKGVQLTHLSFCTLAFEIGPPMDLDTLKPLRVLQNAAYAFDVANAETFLTLIFGGTLCITTDEEKRNNLEGSIQRLQITWLYLTPSATSLVNPEHVPTVKTLILGGEAAIQDIVETWAHKVHLVNSYGPAEGGIWPSMAELPPGASPRNIGRGTGTRLWLVDPYNSNRLTGPLGTVGELLLEGPMLTKGYLHEPEKTAAAFVDTPKWSHSLEGRKHFYKTGDLCRYNDDGSFSYVGRKDTQVKLRGQRLELGEVEYHVKLALPEFKNIAVEIVHFAQSKNPYLVAFICSTELFENLDDMGAASPAAIFQLSKHTDGLANRLAAVLPSYMVPSAYIPLPTMPLTVSGKRNRKELVRTASRLTLAHVSSTGHKRAHTLLSNDLERRFQALWSKILKLDAEEITAEDNFLHLGGDSIDAMRLVAAARTEGIKIAVSDVFGTSNLSTMAATASLVDNNPSPLAIEQTYQSDACLDYEGAMKLVESQLHIKINQVEDILEAGDFQSHAVYFGLMESRGCSNYLIVDFDVAVESCRVQTAYESLVAQHPVLRTVFIPYSSKMLQVVLRKMTVELELCDCVFDIEACTHRWITKDKLRESTLTKSVIRGMITKLVDGGTRFVIQQSHARNDAWSDHHFCTDLAFALEQKPFPKRPSYLEFIRFTKSQNPSTAEEYWRSLLEGSEMTKVIQYRNPGCHNIVSITLQRFIPTSTMKGHGITFATLLKAAWSLVLMAYSGKTDLIFGHLISGRNLPLEDIDQIIGPCLNIIPTRARISPGTVLSLLSQLQSQHVLAIPHEWLPERHIVRNCTTWPLATRFSSVVQHQNIEEIQNLATAGLDWKIRLHAIDYDSADIWILSFPRGEKMEITLCYSEHMIEEKLANDMLDALCANIEYLASHADEELDLSQFETSENAPVLPIMPPSNTIYNSPNLTLPDVHDSVARSIVEEAWKPIWAVYVEQKEKLGRESVGSEKEHTRYYDIAAEPWVAVQLALAYKEKGVDVSVEEMVDWPDMRGQEMLVARKMRDEKSVNMED